METILFMPTKNKIYKMKKETGSTFFTVTFGHVGQSMHEKKYPESEWDNVYQEKMRLGYIDQTSFYQGEKVNVVKEDRIAKDDKLNTVLQRMRDISKQMVSDNYKISSITISKSMIDAAFLAIDELEHISDTWKFNEKLMELFSLIPRKMRNVLMFTARNESDFNEILEREKDLLHNLSVNQSTDREVYSDKITYESCNEEELETIRKLLDPGSKSKFKNAWKVCNKETDIIFKKYCKERHVKDTKLLFHGTRTENWWSILQTKLLKKPANAVHSGSMFGAGIYFANKATKSLGYTSMAGSYWANGKDNTAYLGLYEVAYGNPEHISEWKAEHSCLTEENLKKNYSGKHCVHAHAGKNLINDEIIIYNEDACTIRYLLEFSK